MRKTIILLTVVILSIFGCKKSDNLKLSKKTTTVDSIAGNTYNYYFNGTNFEVSFTDTTYTFQTLGTYNYTVDNDTFRYMKNTGPGSGQIYYLSIKHDTLIFQLFRKCYTCTTDTAGILVLDTGGYVNPYRILVMTRK